MEATMTTSSDPAQDAPSASPRQRRAPKGEKRREELLDAALQLFSLEGYTGASIARIAERVGISVAGVLHHFPSKTALLMGVLDRRDEVSRKIADEVRGDGSLDGLFGSLRAINRSNAGAPGVVRAFSILNAESLVEGHPAWDWYQARYQDIYGRLGGHLRELVGRGEVREDVDLEAITQQILAMMDGLQLQWLRFPEQVDLERSFDAYIEQVDQAIRRPS
jgi:AcrR family transcriptional regulator